MIILVDMDDTMELLLPAWVNKVNARYGTKTTCEDIVTWDVSAAFPSLSMQQVYEVILEDDFWKDVEPAPGAQKVLKRFLDRGHEVYLVTATPYESVRGKMEQHLFPHFPFFTWGNVIITSRKQLIRGDVLIDDGVHNLEGGDFYKILVDAPYNRTYDAKANGMVRVHSWEEIEREVLRIEKMVQGEA